jgi:DNA-binding LacI/PurR family transcriptional regulator
MGGYLAALKDAKIEPDKDWVCIYETSAKGDLAGDLKIGESLASRVFECGVTAVFCYCDTVAVGTILELNRLGIRIPEQVSVMGFDDNDLCEIVCPPLSTVSQPKRKMGQMAMDMMLACLDGKPVLDQVVQPEVIIRGSTARLQD